MKTVYLHIGPHKTGTTLIQKTFYENKEYFLNNYSIDYLNGYKIIFGHHEIVTQLKSNDFNEKELRKLIDSSRAESVFISSENFDILNENEVQRLLSALSCYEVKVVAMYRESSLRLYSWWQEEIKHGSTESFPEYALPHLSRPMVSDIFNLDVILSRYLKYLNTDSLLIGDYDSFLKFGGIEVFFENAMNFKFPHIHSNKKIVNKGLGEFDVEMIRVFNTIFKRTIGFAGSAVREKYLNSKHLLDKEVLRGVKKQFDISLFDVELGDLYQDRVVYQQLSNKYHLSLGSDIDRNSLCIMKRIPRSDWHLDSSTNLDVNKLFSSLFNC